MMQPDEIEDNQNGYLDDTLFVSDDFGTQIVERFDPELLLILNDYEYY